MNSITLIGRLGQDPEIKTLTNGTTVCKFSLATSEKWKDKQSGEMKEKTEWHRIVAWGKQGDVIGQYVKKGQQFALTGQLKYSDWNDKDGNKHTSAEIHLKEFDFIGNKSSSEPAKDNWPAKFKSEEDVSY